MKLSIRKSLCIFGTVGLFALTPIMANAASATISDIDVNTATKAVTVTGSISNYVDGQQVTILGVKKGTDLEELVTTDIAYLDQISSANGNFSFSFTMPTSMQTGTYTVYVGGSEIEEVGIASQDFSLDAGVTVSGNVALSVGGIAITNTTATIMNGSTVVASTNVASDGTYSFSDVEAGNYTIVFAKPGYLTYEKALTVANADVTVDNCTLLAGDIDGNGKIGLSDLTVLKANYNADATLNPACDLDGNGKIGLSDLTVLKANYNMGYAE